MAVSHGMNIEAVRALGNKLQQDYASRIDAVITELNNAVSDTSSTWIGPDAEAFRSWWPAKKSALQAIREDLFGFGQSALNNASEQENASGR